MLAGHGATVVLACRNVGKARQAADQITAVHEHARIQLIRLDLASLNSIRDGARQIRATCPHIDLLINNAGVMEVPYEQTQDGFELTFGTNHLGHFALTGLVLDRLLATPGSRVVTMSSMGHKWGVMNFDDLQGKHGYRPDDAYDQSKLANLLFTYELDRRLRAAGAPTQALAAHPGVVYTDLFRTRSRVNKALLGPWMRPINFWAVHNLHKGALPMLRAATDPAARGGEYYGPHRKHHTGYPVVCQSTSQSHDTDDQARLWQVSEQLTGVHYAVTAPRS
jgi:NAD(P)-dependent dehydrogenase (short-subunit alcohol dehydrogenase family)